MPVCPYCQDTGRVAVYQGARRGCTYRRCSCQQPSREHNVTQAKFALQGWRGESGLPFGLESSIRLARRAGLTDELIAELCDRTVDDVRAVS